MPKLSRYRGAIAVAIVLALAACLPPAFATTKSAYMHYMRALLLQHRGDYAGALKEYSEAATLDPQSTYILEQAAELALETGQSDQALEMARHLTQLDAKNTKARLLLGNVLWARGELKEAQGAFEEALRINPKYSEAMFALGNLLNAQSPYKAKKYFEDYLAANPEHAAEAHFQIALVDERLGQSKESITHLKTAAELEPDFLQARYTLAHLYEVLHDTDAALGQYALLLDREPDNVALLNHVGEIAFLKQDFDVAQARFQRSKTASPHNPGACLWLAILAEQKGDFNLAASELADSAALKEEAELQLRLSYYLTQANRIKEAVAVLEEAHKKWAENNEIAYFLALGYDDVKEPEKAVVLLREILRRSPDSRDARFQLASLYEKLDKVDDMEREFRLLLQQHPDDSSALNYLGYSLTDRGLKLQEAEGFIRRAIGLDPRNGAYLDSLGWSYFKQGRLPEAIKALQDAIQSAGEDAAVWEHLGDAQKAKGDASAAWISWKTGLAYEPANDKLLKKVAEIEAGLSSDELGTRLVDYLRRLHGGIDRVGTVCEVSGTILDKTFSFNGLLTYESAGKLRLELLGPLFVPIFHLELNGSNALTMDPLPLRGVPPATSQEFALQTFRLLRDYLSGRIFDKRSAQYHRGWRTRWIATPNFQLFLDDANQQLQGLKTSDPAPLRLSLDDFQAEHGRYLPTYLKIEGKGFSISLRLMNPSVRYQAPAAGGQP